MERLYSYNEWNDYNFIWLNMSSRVLDLSDKEIIEDWRRILSYHYLYFIKIVFILLDPRIES